ncbi:Mor transcription activator family protein [Solidesulfovibrio sp.]
MKKEQLEAIVAQAIGQDLAQKVVEAIVDEWGGSLEHIPTGNGQVQARSARNAEIRRLFRAGVGVESLAERFRVSQKTVYRVLGD